MTMIDGTEASFWEHLEALRQTIVKSIIPIFLCTFLFIIFYQSFLNTLSSPFNQSKIQTLQITKKRIVNQGDKILYSLKANEFVPNQTKREFLIENGDHLDIECHEEPSLKFFSPLDGMITLIKTSFWFAVILTSPYWLYNILLFIAPALNKKHQSLILPFWSLAIALFFLGLLFAWSISIPWATQILSSFNDQLGENIWGFKHYLDFTLLLLLATGLSFESGAILLFLVHIGFLNATHLTKKRRHAVVGIFIFSAILTPPDIFTQILLAIPLMILYELTILYALFRMKTTPETIDIYTNNIKN